MLKKINKKTFLGKSVLVRCDYNVPLNSDGSIQSTSRVQASFETINFLLDCNCKIVLCSHLGRPKGKEDASLSLKGVYEYLKSVYGSVVHFSTLGVKDMQKAKETLKNGEILLLENLRFDEREESNSEDFARMLSSGMDLFVDEAFATSHRECASNNAVLKFLPQYFGFNYIKEAKELTLKDKIKPIIALLGGAKVSDKITLIDKLIDKVDELFIGGALANTFLYAKGYAINKESVELDRVDIAKKLLAKSVKKHKALHLPCDFVVIDANGNIQNRHLKDLQTTDFCFDIGKATITEIKHIIDKPKGTIFWNGPLGKTSDERFCTGTVETAKALAKSACYTIVGGGDTASVLQKYKLQDKMDFVSTGGGASLKYIQRG